jgi:hypothetical protein
MIEKRYHSFVTSVDPTKWNFSSGKTWEYMIGGALIGGLSGGLAYGLATLGIPFANTASIMASSFSISIGMNVMIGGQTDASVSFGFGSYNLDSGEFGYLCKTGNKWYEDLGNGLGAMANLKDLNDNINMPVLPDMTFPSGYVIH